MKKILLTLGTTGVIATPLVTVIACGQLTTPSTKTFEPSFDANAKELTVARTTYVDKSEIVSTASETSIKSFLNDLHTVFIDNAYGTSEKIKLTKNEEEAKNETITISDITFDPGTTSTNINPTNLAEVKALSWQTAENASINGKIMDLTANQNMTWQLFSKEKTTIIEEVEDDSSILVELNKLNIISTKYLMELTEVADSPAITEGEANTRFGIVKAQFDSIITALGGITSDWRFINIDFDATSSKFKLTYRHSNESANREIDLATTPKFEDSLIRDELNKLNIASTKTLTELNAIIGTPATTEKEANTKFGINSVEFKKITDALGNDWKFVNIDFDEASSKFKLTYRHSSETSNREIDLAITTKAHDDLEVITRLNLLNFTSTKTLRELTNAAGTPATTEEELNTRFGLEKLQFDWIILSLGWLSSEWEFVNIDFDTTSLKFKLTYKHSTESNNRTFDLKTNFKLEDDSAIIIELNKLNIVSTKTFTELRDAEGTPATSETDANTRFGIVKDQFDSIITALGGVASEWKFVNIDFDAASSKFKLTYKYSNEPNNRIINLLATTKEHDDSGIVTELDKLNIASTKTLRELTNAAGTPATTEEDANTIFGIVKAQFDSIIAALGGEASEWKFVNIDFDTTSSKFKLTYKHSHDTSNREFDLLTTPKLEDGSEIITELNKLNIISTKDLDELTNAADTPATTEEEANTRFGIVKAQFDLIIAALGGETSDWEFVNIDFDATNSKFKLTYKHSSEQVNRDINLDTTPKFEDSLIRDALNQLNIASTKTLTELNAIVSTPATSEEDANTIFGINSVEFKKITDALGNDWEFVNIDFDTTSSKFKLTYKHSSEQLDRDMNLATTPKFEDSLIRDTLNQLNITSTKTLTELKAIVGTPATTEEEANTRFGINSVEFKKITDVLGNDWEFVNIYFDTLSSEFKLTYKHSSEQFDRDINLATTPKFDDTTIRDALNQLNITSTKTLDELKAIAGTPATTEEEANTRFGINSVEFKKITDALGNDWEFVNIDFDEANSKFKLTFKHSSEQFNREIDLVTTTKQDDSLIIRELNKLNIASTKTLDELKAIVGTPATTEEEANTKFGINSVEFKKITDALGNDWEFVNIYFDTSSSEFKLTYKHSSEQFDRDINLATTPKFEDSLIRDTLNQLNITSTKTSAELLVAAIVSTPATSEEEANTRFGIVKTEFDKIITALGGETSDWEFVNIYYNTSSSGFTLTYKHSSEQFNRDIDLATTEKADDITIRDALNELNITSTKTLDDLKAIAGNPVKTETAANSLFGINSVEFKKITDALGNDWEFVNIDFDQTNLKFKLTYKHSSEQFNREIDLVTTTKPDDSLIIRELNKLNITSTKTFKELIAAADTPATTEEDANTKFGINSVEFKKITDALGNDWEFVNIDFEWSSLKFKLTYKHSSETNNREAIDLTATAKQDDSGIVTELNKLEIISTKTFKELQNAADTPATTEEEADTIFGIVKTEFDKIITALSSETSDWKFVNIDFDQTSLKFKLTYIHNEETNNRNISLNTIITSDPEDELTKDLNSFEIKSDMKKSEVDDSLDSSFKFVNEDGEIIYWELDANQIDKLKEILSEQETLVKVAFSRTEEYGDRLYIVYNSNNQDYISWVKISFK